MTDTANDMLLAIVNGHTMGNVSHGRDGRLRFSYDESWPAAPHAYSLSLSMPLIGPQYEDEVVRPFLQGLLPDNDRVLERWGQRFGVSARSPFALLHHVGEDCAGAVQFVRPERADTVLDSTCHAVDWLTERDIAERLRTLHTDHTAWQASQREGQFSLAGAQPKIALLFEHGQLPRGP